MRLQVRVRDWSAGRQKGFQFSAPDIRRLAGELAFPDINGRYESLEEFIRLVSAGRHPDSYTRSVRIVVVSGKKQSVFGIDEPYNNSFSHTRTSLQNHLEIRGGEMDEYINHRIGANVDAEYVTSPALDTLILGGQSASGMDRALEEFGKGLPPRRKVAFQDDRRAQIGVFFEQRAVEFCRRTWPDWELDWRYPYLVSQFAPLAEMRIGCDIDMRQEGRYKCVEVKSIKGAPGMPFILTKNEYESRESAKKLAHVDYVVLVYYYADLQHIPEPILIGNDELFKGVVPYSYQITPVTAG